VIYGNIDSSEFYIWFLQCRNFQYLKNFKSRILSWRFYPLQYRVSNFRKKHLQKTLQIKLL
jgi:hypothetical protein